MRNNIFACLLKCEGCRNKLDYAYVKKHGYLNLNYACLELKFNDFKKFVEGLTDDEFKFKMLECEEWKPDCFISKGKDFKL